MADVIGNADPVEGTIAHDAVDSGNPVKIGGRAIQTPAGVAVNDRVDAYFDAWGKLVVAEGNYSWAVGTASVSTTATALGSNVAYQVLLQADPDNANDIFIGNSISQPFQLVPGSALNLPVGNTTEIYHKTASGSATLNWIAILRP